MIPKGPQNDPESTQKMVRNHPKMLPFWSFLHCWSQLIIIVFFPTLGRRIDFFSISVLGSKIPYLAKESLSGNGSRTLTQTHRGTYIQTHTHPHAHAHTHTHGPEAHTYSHIRMHRLYIWVILGDFWGGVIKIVLRSLNPFLKRTLRATDPWRNQVKRARLARDMAHSWCQKKAIFHGDRKLVFISFKSTLTKIIPYVNCVRLVVR